MVRPTYWVHFPKSALGMYSIPCSIRFASGVKQSIICKATTADLLVLPQISKRLLASAGGPQSNNGSRWTHDFFTRRNSILVPVTIEIKTKGPKLSTSFLALVSDKITDDADLLVGPPVLSSLGEYGYGENYLSIHHPKYSNFCSKNLDDLLGSAVLVLGNDSTKHLQILRQMQVCINQFPRYDAWLLKDYEDIWHLDLAQKLLLMAATSAFVVIEDSVKSGHMTEIGLLANLRSPIAFIRDRNRKGSWMSDPLVEGNLRRTFEYDLTRDSTSLWYATHLACSWARKALDARAIELNKRYPWREQEVARFTQGEYWR